jgi:hypothetical protein
VPAGPAGCSCQFGRASAPMMPQRVHTMRGPNDGTGTSSDHGSALRVARWWHSQQHTSSDRTPLARMLSRVIGGPAWDRDRVLIAGRIWHACYRGSQAAASDRGRPFAEGRERTCPLNLGVRAPRQVGQRGFSGSAFRKSTFNKLCEQFYRSLKRYRLRRGRNCPTGTVTM